MRSNFSTLSKLKDLRSEEGCIPIFTERQMFCTLEALIQGRPLRVFVWTSGNQLKPVETTALFASLKDVGQYLAISDEQVFRQELARAGVKVVSHPTLRDHVYPQDKGKRVYFLDHAAILHVLVMRLGAQYVSEIYSALQATLSSAHVEAHNAIEDCEDDREEDSQNGVSEVLVPMRMEVDAAAEVRAAQPAWESIMIPKSFSRQQYTKQYALRDYDISMNLRAELADLKLFWMKPFNAARSANPVNAITFSKRYERILCYFGYLVQFKCMGRNDLALNAYCNWRAFESFISYLKEVRMLSCATVAEFVTAAVFVAKYLHRGEESPGSKFQNVVLVKRYRDWRNQQASMANRERKDETWDELREQSKWLHWDEYCTTVQELQDKFTAFNGVVSLKSAKVLHDVLLLIMFRFLPARSAEVRLLEYISEEDVMAAKGKLTFRQCVDKEKINLLTHRDGKWTMSWPITRTIVTLAWT
jgi:hypothetical protein